SARERQLDDERRTAPLARGDGDAAGHAPNELAADVEAEPGSTDPARLLSIDAVELPEDPLLLAVGDPQALVADHEPQPVLFRLDAHLDAPSVRRVLDRIVDEVDQHLAQLVLVARHLGGRVG